MKNMRKIILAMITVAFAVCTVGCAFKNPLDKGGVAEVGNYEKCYTYDLHVEGECEEPRDEYYTLYILDDTRLRYENRTVYSENNEYISVFVGDYEKTDEGILFKYRYVDEAAEDGYSWETFFLMSNDKITGIRSSDEMEYIKIAGTYTGETEDYGTVTLTISEEGDCKVEENGNTHDAYIYCAGDNTYEVSVYEDEFCIDWYIAFDGNTFSIGNCMSSSGPGGEDFYLNNAGTLLVSGSLGDISVELTDAGEASSTIDIDGKSVKMTGFYYAGEDGESIGEIDLSDDDCIYSLYLFLTNNGGNYTYEGSLSRQL